MDEVKLNREDEPQPTPKISDPASEIKPAPEMAESQAEMPEDFEDPEGKSGKWKIVKGEVEVEGKKVEVSYREKVIELPKHRQGETGIKRIRRRELLPPFPEGLYISPYSERFFPSYSTEKKYDDFYGFLTNGGYPKHGTLVHILDYALNGQKGSREIKNVQQFIKEGMYFQKISAEGGKHFRTDTNEGIHCNTERAFIDSFTTPIFVFGDKNKIYNEYMSGIPSWRQPDTSKDNIEEILYVHEKKLIRGTPIEPLRWCHAECALVPTKRSLNVLFFETGDEDKNKKEEK